jgi:hypothetical protein
MKRLSTLIAIGVVLLACVAPATAGADAYQHYVGCGLTEKDKPSHRCAANEPKGAFFKSFKANVYYSICIKFPDGKNLCASKQKAKKGTLYVNKITSTLPGRHQVTWFVGGKRVGVFVFRVTG